MKSSIKALLVIGFGIILSACGSTPQSTVSLPTLTTGPDDTLKVAYVYNKPEGKATTHIYGASCLLCYGVASGLTSSLDKHLESTIDTSELDSIADLVVEKYKSRYASVEQVELTVKEINKLKKFKGELGFANKDFRGLKEKLNADILVVINFQEHGAFRSFSSYIPNGDPQGYVNGILYAVNLNDNSYVQYQALRAAVQPAGEWDEPDTFPAVTTSYYQAVEDLKQKLNTVM